MKTIVLNKGESFYLEKNCYTIISGKGISKYITSEGKIINNERIYTNGDILYNAFYIDHINKSEDSPEFLFKAFHDTILKIIQLDNPSKEKLLIQIYECYTLNKKISSLNNLEYLLYIFKIYSTENTIDKSIITHDDFNISRSQFYLILQKIKKNNLIIENRKTYFLNY